MEPDEKEALYTLAAGVGLLLAGLYGMHLAGLRFNMGVSA